MSEHVLLLTPSCGLGGGIERYAETLEWAFAAKGVQCRRVDLRRAGAAGHARMLIEARKQLRSSTDPTRLVLAHRTLLPAAALLSRERLACGISVVCHGSDVWCATHRARRGIETYLMRRSGVRVVAVSSFTAGALAENCTAAILPPGLSMTWFDMLIETSASTQDRKPGARLLTAFRLDDWRDKGLPQIVDAVAALNRPDVQVTVCGSGEPSADLLRLIRERRHYCTLRTGLTDRELARQFVDADLFVLATRTRAGKLASGEGFGLVLAEAQVAGTPVVGPAYGGSHDAYVDGVTGVTPADETAESLTRVLDQILQDPRQLADMGRRAAEWARVSYAPDRYASRVIATLL